MAKAKSFRLDESTAQLIEDLASGLGWTQADVVEFAVDFCEYHMLYQRSRELYEQEYMEKYGSCNVKVNERTALATALTSFEVHAV